ncbi:hypothetical protein DXG01_003889 [Tephrocybe rancida]|nr:hypothetical protein DXG01_003889 [Tephrocybe rancida]
MAAAKSSITALAKNDPLDSLRSPDVTTQDREELTDTEFNDIALDDDAGFSAVPLTNDSSTAQEIPNDVEPPDTARPRSVTTPLTAVFNPIPARTGHKKSASTTTIRSGNNLPFIVSRLQDEHRMSHRGSVDGQQKLQEEFKRLHKEEVQEDVETAAAKAIDWVAGGSDYQGFAAERPEELASAIARGIPDTLRGMMWQHMAASKDPELEDTYLKLLKEMPDEEAFSLLVRLIFPLPVVFRIYDNCLASGIEAIFGFSIMLLKKNEDELLALKFDEILAFLNTQLFDKYKASGLIMLIILSINAISSSEAQSEDTATYDVDAFVQDAVALHITPFMLDSYRHEYEDQLRETNKHMTEMDELRTTNRSLSSQVKSLENSLAQLNTEHVDLLNELVKSRLRNEEMEEELVRYKLLYAEAMHENQDAQSSHRISIAQMLRLKRGSNT